MGLEGGDLAVEAQHRARDECPPGGYGGVVDEVAGGEVVAAVEDEVVVAEEPGGVGFSQPFVVGLDADGGVERPDGGGGALGLGPADAVRAVDHLALEVGDIDIVVVDDAERADPSGGEIEQDRRAEAARAHRQHARGQQLLLPRAAHLRQNQVAGVAVELRVGQHGGAL